MRSYVRVSSTSVTGSVFAIVHLATCHDIVHLFLGDEPMPGPIAYSLYLALRRGGQKTREEAAVRGVERAWTFTPCYVAEGIRRCRDLFGERLVLPTFGYWVAEEHAEPSLKDVEFVEPSNTSVLSKLFRPMMSG